MAAAESTGLTFVDEEEIPIVFVRIAHVDSENEQPSDVDSSEDEESTDESGEENDDSNGEEEQNYSNLRCSSEIRAPQDRNFNEEVGMRVEMEENSSCLQYFELLFTNDVNQLILNETIRLNAKNVILIAICETSARFHYPRAKGMAWSHFKYGFSKKKQY